MKRKTKINIAIVSAVAIASYYVLSSYKSEPDLAFVDLIQYNLDQLNAYRQRNGIAPLTLDPNISTFALEGSHQLANDHAPHAHFIARAKGSGVFGSAFAENQGDPNGVPPLDKDPNLSGRRQVDIMLKMMFDEGPMGSHYKNMMNSQYRKVGIGIFSPGGKMFMTNDFSD